MPDALFELTSKGVLLSTISKYQEKGIDAAELLKIPVETLLEQQERDELKEDREQSRVVDALQFFNHGQFLHDSFGRYLVKHCGACRIHGTLHVKRGNIYSPMPEAVYGAMLRVLPDIKTAKRNEVEQWLKYSPEVPEREVSPPNFIPFATEVYDIETDKFFPYGDSFTFLNSFPTDYDPNARDDAEVLETIAAIANFDNEILTVIYEQLGAIFYRENKFRGAPLLYGSTGSNGKSTLLNLAEQIAGTENTAHLSMEDCGKRFRLLTLYGKALNAGDDISDSLLADTSTIKKLLTGEPVVDEYKGGALVEFVSYAKLFFACNSLPPVSDKSSAFYSRFLIIPLNHDFSKDGNQNVDLKAKKWTARQLACITKYSVNAFREVIKRGGFTVPEVVRQETERYRIENNPILGFLLENSIVDGTPTATAYMLFRDFCEDNGHRNIVTQARFTRAICNERNMIVKNTWKDGRTQRCFVSK